MALSKHSYDQLSYRIHLPLIDDYNSLDNSVQENWDDIAIDERSKLENRDHEYISEHSANSEGYQYISGNTG